MISTAIQFFGLGVLFLSGWLIVNIVSFKGEGEVNLIKKLIPEDWNVYPLQIFFPSFLSL